MQTPLISSRNTVPQGAPTPGTEPAGLPPEAHKISVGWGLTTLSLSMLLPALGTSIANVALPTLTAVFSASFQEVQWVILAYLLATTTLVVSMGKLGDLMGRRRLLIAGICLFTAASVVAAFAPTLWLLIAARGVQGAGAAVMLTLTIALVGQMVPKERMGSAMGLLGTMSAVGTALGPTLGGMLIVGLGWPAIFAINLPLGIVAVMLALRHLPVDPSSTKSKRPKFDLTGTLVLGSTLGAYALAVTIGRGSFGAMNLLLLCLAVLGSWLFVTVETRVSAPLISIALFSDREMSARLATSAAVSTVVMATLVVGPFYLSQGLSLGTAAVGMVMSIGPLVAALSGAPAGRLVDRIGAQRVSFAGLVGMAVGCFTLFATPVVPGAVGILSYVAPLALITAGYAAFQAANNTQVVERATESQRGVVSGLLALSRNLGLISGASLMGAIFAAASGTANLATAEPSALVEGMHITFATATALVLAGLAMTAASRPNTHTAGCR